MERPVELDPRHMKYPLGIVQQTTSYEHHFIHVSDTEYPVHHRFSSPCVNRINTGTKPDHLAVERLFEDERLRSNPKAPSRTTCLYAWTCENCARAFAHKYRKDRAHYAHLIVVEPKSAFVCLDMSWFDCAMQILGERLNRESLEQEGVRIPLFDSKEEGVRKCAEAYWRGDRCETYDRFLRVESLVSGSALVCSVKGF